MPIPLLVFGAGFLLLLGYAIGIVVTVLFGARLISDHVEGRFARREKPEPADEAEISPAGQDDREAAV